MFHSGNVVGVRAGGECALAMHEPRRLGDERRAGCDTQHTTAPMGPLRAIALICLARLLIPITDAGAKFVDAKYSIWQAVWSRYFFGSEHSPLHMAWRERANERPVVAASTPSLVVGSPCTISEPYLNHI